MNAVSRPPAAPPQESVTAIAPATQIPPPGCLFLDHVAHFVPDLDAAARLLDALGFAVTPRSDQSTQDGPAGTSNRCLMLNEGYIEILTPTHDTPNARRLRDAMARYSGVHLACFSTPAAEEEHVRLAAHGFEPQPLVRLQREVQLEGEDAPRTAAFFVARPAPDKMPEGRVQFVQHLTPECLWQPRWLRHDNGVAGLAAVFVVADDPVQVAARFAHFSALVPHRAGEFIRLGTDRGKVLIGVRNQWAELLGDAPVAPAIAGYALACDDPDAFAARCARAGLAIREVAAALHAVTLPPELGGAWLFGEPDALETMLSMSQP